MLTKEMACVRIDILYTVLVFSSYKSAIFKTGERICINQERAALLDALSFYDGIIDKEQVRQYRVPGSIEKKITTCIDMITRTNWVPPAPETDDKI